jgi:hypothetical protein
VVDEKVQSRGHDADVPSPFTNDMKEVAQTHSRFDSILKVCDN